ncbi:MAG TPA: superoxide dismutase [Deltaproteobacteria bacterium]|nr:MAG: superoxide dismutase [Deltaproteobacteria bacterium GWA2_55_82]OGQ64772.1 MAG: superoxide dismutase [Deltaproteobacteria bacterium RIFCSPLOWO2_02_FULL_55_12]OIJ72620.1 MAG: superoxide dismutase [Deltaproteobacteria bacterium GWC2_55_46]HBG47222.1 superoxide dismutase [Deltaproteobacteria bacterium]HCY11966.1 superoxide dismutase [Deltaproteobacteria bacterium]
MPHQPKKFDIRPEGLSEAQITNHRDILYVGYVNKLNEIEERQRKLDTSTANQVFSDWRAVKIEESFALNGVILHEYYFENLTGKGGKPTAKLGELISREWGSFEKWSEEFKASGLACRGWVILALSIYDGKLHNFCLDAHNEKVPINIVPILVMDVYEHAYFLDYGAKRAPYIDAFMKNINWNICQKRLERVDLDQVMKEAAS